MSTIESYKELLKAHHLSVTSIRIAALQALESNPHSNADQLFNVVKEELATTSKQAIYNTLKTLVEHGLIREIKPKGCPSLYETRVGDNHHHLVCRQCQAVVDTDCFDAAPCLEPMDKQGFVIDEAEVIFWGTCPSCQQMLNEVGEHDE